MKLKSTQLLILSFLFFQFSFAQVTKDSKLYQEILKMDQLLFDEGFNNCNLEDLRKILHPELDFFHDKGGLSDAIKFMSDTKQYICSTPNRKPIRKLVESSMEIYPLYNNGVLYGAIQNGTHDFYIKEPNKELYKTNIAKFSSTWILVEDKWKLKTVSSYDHQEP